MKQQEEKDHGHVEAKLRRALTPEERCHIGVSNVRKFLETELLRRYQEHLPAITGIVNGETKRMVHGPIVCKSGCCTQFLGGLFCQKLPSSL